MPLTPFHLGPGLFFGMLTLRFINLLAFLVGSVIMDIEPLALILARRCYLCAHHPFLHTIIGGIIGSLIVALIFRKFKKPLEKLSLKLRIKQSFSFLTVYFSCLSAWILHVFLDAIIHKDVFPFWPSKYNPFLIGFHIIWKPLYLILFILGVIGLILFYKHYKNSYRSNCHPEAKPKDPVLLPRDSSLRSE